MRKYVSWLWLTVLVLALMGVAGCMGGESASNDATVKGDPPPTREATDAEKQSRSGAGRTRSGDN